MTKTRIYAVTLNPDRVLPIASLVEASSPSAALRHVARAAFDVAVASQHDLVELTQRGVNVENASEPSSSSAIVPEMSAEDSGHVVPSGEIARGRARTEDSGQPDQLDIGDIPPCLDRRRNVVTGEAE